MKKYVTTAEKLSKGLLRKYEAFRKSKEFHRNMPREALQLHVLHLAQKGVTQSQIADEIGWSRNSLCRLLADKDYPVSCEVIAKLCIRFDLDPEVAEEWLRGWEIELDSRIPTYQFYRLMIRRYSELGDNSVRIKYIKLVGGIEAIRDVEKHEEEWVRRLCAKAIEHAREHNLRTFIRVHKAKNGVKDDHYERDEIWEQRFRDPERVIQHSKLEEYAKELQLSGKEKQEFFRIAGYIPVEENHI